MRSLKLGARIALFLAASCCTAQHANAQWPTSGVPPFGTVQPGGFDATNLQNLNSIFSISLMSSPGRGFGLSYGMTYNSAFWYPAGVGVWTPTLDGSGNPTFGWNIQGSMGTVGYQTQVLPSCGYNVKYSNFTYTDTSGTVHPFSFTLYSSSSCGATAGSGAATDNSNYQLLSTAVTGGVSNSVFFPTGLGQTDTKLTDINGNYITKTISGSETDWTDTVGRTALKVNTGSSTTTYKWLDQTGSYQTTTVVYTSFNIKTNFGCGWVEYTGTANLPSEIDLPNGNKYLFTYETTPGYSGYTTGRVQKVTLPGGGYYQYDYAGPNNGTSCSDATITNLTRTINDGTNSVQWLYDRSGGLTIVTAPQMPYDSAPNQSTFAFNSNSQDTQEKYYRGYASGSPLRTVDKTYATNGTPLTQKTTNDTGQMSEVDTTYDSNGNLTQSKEFDWGIGAVGSLLRETDVTYVSAVYPPFPMTQKLVKDASGNVIYREDRAYDGISLVSVTGANQHDDTNYGTSNGYRMNLTSSTTYSDPVTPSGGLKTTFMYNTVGNLVTVSSGTTSSVVQQKQFTYSSTTQYAAPDSIMSGPTGGAQLTTSYTYNAYTGQVTSMTDPNLQTTYYYYDVYKRATSVTRPDGAQLTTSYNDSAFSVTSTTPIDATPHKKITVTAFDGLGRSLTNTLEDYAGTVYSITQTEYDPLGRTYKSSNPYTSSPSYWTTSEFDALGRPIATILPDGSQSTLSYSGNMVIGTDPTGRQRKSYFDAPGRLIQVDEPSGTVTLVAGSGSATVSGSEYHHPATVATSGRGGITIGGSEQSFSVDNPVEVCDLYDCGGDCIRSHWQDVWTTYYDQGTVTVTVNGHPDSVTYGSSSSPSTIASALTTVINGDSSASVNATVSGAVITLTAKTTGTSSDYPLSGASTSTDSTGYFYGASFSAGASGDVLTGGAPATSASNDTGTVSITVDGAQISVPYGSSSTSSGLATALASAVNGASLPVSASTSGSTITLAATTSGASTNYSLSSGSASNNPPSYFVGGVDASFTITASGSALSGGLGPDQWASPVSTTYTYNVLDGLTGVTQGSQTRTYVYDGIGRVTSSSIPETTSGGTQHTSYSNYDSDSNCSTPNSFPRQLVSTVDARGVRTCMQYDGLNRITAMNYVTVSGVTSTSSVSYAYGTSTSLYNKGRLLSIGNGTSSESYNYDILGRTTEVDKVIGSTTYSTEYTYNLAGEVTLTTYPSVTTKVAQTYDAVGRLCGVGASGSTCSSGTRYSSGYNYNPAGEVTGFTYGNGVVANLSYSPDRLQLRCLQYDTTSLSDPCTKDTSALFMITYGYGSSGSNNGQIATVTDGVDNGRTANYTYDGLGRLSTASTVGSTSYPAWGLSWTYDRFGNRTAQSNTAGSVPSDTLVVSASTNQITDSGYSYDADGNMTSDAFNTMTYDAASHLVTSANGTSSGAYSYDGSGVRVKKCVPNCSSSTITTVYIFSGGRVIAEYDNGAAYNSPSREYVYSGATQIAKIAGGVVTYYHQDHLSNRLITSNTGSVVEQMGHLPFGEGWYDTGSDKWRLGTYERDAESGNDYAAARYGVSRLGRFSSPDLLSGVVANPQSLNHYAYGGNDPINLSDPTGLEPCDPASYSLQNPMPAFCNMETIDSDGGPTAFGLGGCVQCEMDYGFLMSFFADQLAQDYYAQGYNVSINGQPAYTYASTSSKTKTDCSVVQCVLVAIDVIQKAGNALEPNETDVTYAVAVLGTDGLLTRATGLFQIDAFEQYVSGSTSTVICDSGCSNLGDPTVFSQGEYEDDLRASKDGGTAVNQTYFIDGKSALVFERTGGYNFVGSFTIFATTYLNKPATLVPSGQYTFPAVWKH